MFCFSRTLKSRIHVVWGRDKDNFFFVYTYVFLLFLMNGKQNIHDSAMKTKPAPRKLKVESLK